MKKIISLFLAAFMTFSFAACSKNNDKSPSGEENLSGINSTVTKQETVNGAVYNFEGYFTTTVPAGISAEDISINADSTLFNFFDSVTLFDVSFAERYETEAEVIAIVEEMATMDSASKTDPITVNEFTFYGATLPEYGMMRYIGFVNGYDVTISVYTDLQNEAWKSFVENTVFTVS